MNTNGTGFTVLKHFTQETPNPIGRLTLSGDILFGISKPTFERPTGQLFRVNTNGTGFLVVKSFRTPSGTTVSRPTRTATA